MHMNDKPLWIGKRKGFFLFLAAFSLKAGPISATWTFQNICLNPCWPVCYRQVSGTETNVFLLIFDAFGCSPRCFIHIRHLSSRVSGFGKVKDPTSPSKLSLTQLSDMQVPWAHCSRTLASAFCLVLSDWTAVVPGRGLEKGQFRFTGIAAGSTCNYLLTWLRWKRSVPAKKQKNPKKLLSSVEISMQHMFGTLHAEHMICQSDVQLARLSSFSFPQLFFSLMKVFDSGHHRDEHYPARWIMSM